MTSSIVSRTMLASCGLRSIVLSVLVTASLALGACGDSETEKPSGASAAPATPRAPQAAQVPASARAITLTDQAGDAGRARGLDLLGASMSIANDRALVRVLLRDSSEDRRVRLRLGQRTVDIVERGGRFTTREMPGAEARGIAGGIEVSLPWSGSRPPRSWNAATFAGATSAKADEFSSAGSRTRGREDSAAGPTDQSW